ncbi:hypothetical protein D1970_02030 [Mesobacillus zeae]|uniref:Uncharacterized protein n=1 Tax=Mesobacillus zeae TaxID=1917180 RepID=A0A398BDG7_9BACI|nr:hypothetical protein D1970_02030 [Mesobacillus zeae]
MTRKSYGLGLLSSLLLAFRFGFQPLKVVIFKKTMKIAEVKPDFQSGNTQQIELVVEQGKNKRKL